MTQKEEYTTLIRTIDQLPQNLRCSSCRTKKSTIWYQCGQGGCELVYCDKKRCYETAAEDHHSNLDEDEGEVPHKYRRTPIRMELNLPQEEEETNVNEIIKTEKKLKTMSLSENNRNGKNLLATGTMVLSTVVSTASKIPLTEISSSFAKLLVKTSNNISGGTCGLFSVVGAGIDLGITTYRFFSGEIKEWSELGKEILQKTIKHAATFGIVYGTTKVFMMSGMAFGGPIGAVIGGVIGFGASYIIDQKFDKYWPRNDEKNLATQKIVKNALRRFGFKPRDINNPKIFNKVVINKKYKSYARECHPDSKMGKKLDDARERFIELNAHFGVLMGICERIYGKSTDKEDKKVFRKQLSIMCSNF